MSGVEPGLGVAITRAARFLSKVVPEAGLLLREFEGQLANHKFTPVHGNHMALERNTGNFAAPQRWLHTSFVRLLGQGSGGKTRNCVALELSLAPDVAEEALLIVGFAEFPTPRKRTPDVWQDFRDGDWIESLLAGVEMPVGKVHRFTRPEEHSRVFASASEVRVLAVPLVSLRGPEDVQQLVEEQLAGWWRKGASVPTG